MPAWRATQAASSVTLLSSFASVTFRSVTSTELMRPPRPAVSWTVTLGLKEARQKSGLVGAGHSTFTGIGFGVIVRSMCAELGGGVGVGEGVGSVDFAQSHAAAASTNSATAAARCREPTVWSFSNPTCGRGPRV